MKTLVTLSIGGAAVVAAAFLAGPAAASTPANQHRGSESVVLVQTDDPSGNSILAYDRADDGTLSQAGIYSTGGLGGVLEGSVVDHLASQGSLSYDSASHTLYAVNAGSDTISVFAVNGDRLSRTQVISSGGTFPVSITTHGHLVYVLNALHGGSIQGFYRLGHHLRLVSNWHRDLNLNEQDPQFTNTPGQVTFSPRGGKLLVTTKASGQSILVFRVGIFGRPAQNPVVNYEGSTVPFAGVFDASGHFVVTEAGSNAVATFTVRPSGVLVPVDEEPTGQTATCWIVRNHNVFYASNSGSGNLSAFADDGQGGLSPLGTTATDGGTVDAAITPDGKYLYVQTGAEGLVDEFRIASNGDLTSIGSVTVPGAVGGEGIVAL